MELRPLLRMPVTVVIATLTIGWAGSCDAAFGDNSRPNIIVVVVDDLRWDELGCAGHPFARTPNIDRIAYEGVRFRNAFCTTPLCSPSRATLLSGLYAYHHGIIDNTDRSERSHQLQTFPRALQAAGYDTAFIGKWHMGDDDTRRPGFTTWVCQKGQGTLFDPVLNVNGETTQFDGHTTDVLSDQAAQFLRQPRDKPFCLYLAHKSIHPQYFGRKKGSLFLPATRHETLYAEEAIPRRLNIMDNVDDKPALRQKIEGRPPLSRATGTSDDDIRGRQRMLADIDDGVGLIFGSLEETGRLDHTVIVFTSDHGFWYGEHGLKHERRLAYEEGIRIPLLVRYPRLIDGGSLIDETALSIDLAPTLLDLAGVSSPMPMDGRSLVPLLRGKTPGDWRTSFLIEYYSDTVYVRIHRMGYKAIRTDRWKYIRYSELDGMDELYDLRNDPYEMTNVIGEPNLKPVLAELNQQLDRLLNAEPMP